MCGHMCFNSKQRCGMGYIERDVTDLQSVKLIDAAMVEEFHPRHAVELNFAVPAAIWCHMQLRFRLHLCHFRAKFRLDVGHALELPQQSISDGDYATTS